MRENNVNFQELKSKPFTHIIQANKYSAQGHLFQLTIFRINNLSIM